MLKKIKITINSRQCQRNQITRISVLSSRLILGKNSSFGFYYIDSDEIPGFFLLLIKGS